MGKDTNWGKIIHEYQNRESKKRFRHGMLKRHLIIESGSKISNKLKIVKGEDPNNNFINLAETINILKYQLPEHGEVALMRHVESDKQDQVYTAKVLEAEDYGTGKLHYLKVLRKTQTVKGVDYNIEQEYSIDPRTPDKSAYVMRTNVYSADTKEMISIDAFNKLIGRKFYTMWTILETPYIPGIVFKNSYDGESDIHGLEEIFDLERQLLKEIQRDLDLSRKKILYKTRLSRKGKGELEIEMLNDSIVVFEDGNAVFTSPIDLWAPQLVIEQITKVIDWLVNYVLKMKFAAKDTMSTGAQKTDEQVSEINQSAQNYLEDKLEMYSLYMNKFLNIDKPKKEWETIVEFELMTTVERLVTGSNTQEKEVPKPAEEDLGGK